MFETVSQSITDIRNFKFTLVFSLKMPLTREIIVCICAVLFSGGILVFNEYRIFSTWSEVRNLKMVISYISTNRKF